MKQIINEDGSSTLVEETAEELAQIAADMEESIRAEKKLEIKVNALTRIQAVLPDVDTFEEVKMLKMIFPLFTPTATGTLVKDIYLYAKNKINQVQTVPIAQVEAYDPSTDVNWPS